MSRKVLAVVMLAPAVPFVVLYVWLDRFAWWLIDVPGWIEKRVEEYCAWVRRVVMGN